MRKATRQCRPEGALQQTIESWRSRTTRVDPPLAPRRAPQIRWGDVPGSAWGAVLWAALGTSFLAHSGIAFAVSRCAAVVPSIYGCLQVYAPCPHAPGNVQFWFYYVQLVCCFYFHHIISYRYIRKPRMLLAARHLPSSSGFLSQKHEGLGRCGGS